MGQFLEINSPFLNMERTGGSGLFGEIAGFVLTPNWAGVTPPAKAKDKKLETDSIFDYRNMWKKDLFDNKETLPTRLQ